MIRISASLLVAAGLLAFASITSHSEPSSNHCKNRVEADCNASVACKWKSTTTNNDASTTKTSCVYDAKAGKALLATQFGVN